MSSLNPSDSEMTIVNDESRADGGDRVALVFWEFWEFWEKRPIRPGTIRFCYCCANRVGENVTEHTVAVDDDDY